MAGWPAAARILDLPARVTATRRGGGTISAHRAHPWQLALALTLALIGGLALTFDRPIHGSATVTSQLVIGVIGDYGCQSGSSCGAISSQQEVPVANLVHSWNPDAIFTVGDNSYENGTATDVQADQQPYATDVTNGIFYPVAGNHDWNNQSSDQTYYATNSGAYFSRADHYVAHLGSGLLDFFATDMNAGDPDGDSSTSVQAQQYQSDVAASTAIWRVTASHQAFYSSGAIGSLTYTHWAILPAIDLFLSGHDHDMEQLIEGGQNFVVDGVGGRNRTSMCSSSCIAGSQWHDDQHFGAVRLTVTPTTLTVDFVALVSGVATLEHSFSLTKGSPSPTPSASPTPTPTPTPSPTPTPTPTPTTGSITGTVTDSVTQVAIAGASVSDGAGATVTNSFGSYTLSNVAPGTYTVTASATGYSGQSQAVSVTAGTATSQLFTLAPLPGTITGTVTNQATGLGIAGATVSYSGGSVLTDASGSYTLSNVAEGSYSVTVTETGYNPKSQTVSVGPGATTQANFVLHPIKHK